MTLLFKLSATAIFLLWMGFTIVMTVYATGELIKNPTWRLVSNALWGFGLGFFASGPILMILSY